MNDDPRDDESQPARDDESHMVNDHRKKPLLIDDDQVPDIGTHD